MDLGLRQQRQIVVLHMPAGIHQVQASSHRQTWIEVVVKPPQHVIAVQLVLFHAQGDRLIRIVAQADGGENDLIEPAPMAVARVHAKIAAQQPDAVSIIHVAAIGPYAAIHHRETVAGFDRLRHVVVARVFATRGAGLLRRRSYHLLRERRVRQQNPSY